MDHIITQEQYAKLNAAAKEFNEKMNADAAKPYPHDPVEVYLCEGEYGDWISMKKEVWKDADLVSVYIRVWKRRGAGTAAVLRTLLQGQGLTVGRRYSFDGDEEEEKIYGYEFLPDNARTHAFLEAGREEDEVMIELLMQEEAKTKRKR